MVITKKQIIGFLALTVVIIIFFIFNYYFHSYYPSLFSANIESIREFIRSFGIWAPIAYIIMLSLAIVISQIPNIPLAIASGAVFGPFWGTIYSIIAGMLGAWICFFIARNIAHDWIKNWLGKKTAIIKQSNKWLFWTIFGTRLLPIFSFDIISYGSGLTDISWKAFTIATFFGMIPATILFAYSGTFLAEKAVWPTTLSAILLVIIIILPTIILKWKKYRRI